MGMSNVEGETLRYVYVLVNDEHRLVYVGQTKQPEVRAKSHRRAALGDALTYQQTHLYRTMRQVGVDSFKFELLMSLDTKALATQAEQLLIDQLRASGEWLVLNDAKASPPKGMRKIKAVVEEHLDRVMETTPIGGELPTMDETALATQSCRATVQRCYLQLAEAGRINRPGRGKGRCRRVA